jgi:hypothetical protein
MDRNAGSKDGACEVSDGNVNSTFTHVPHELGQRPFVLHSGENKNRKNMSTFCPCLETLWKAEFKSSELINEGKVISKQPRIQVWRGYSGCF